MKILNAMIRVRIWVLTICLPLLMPTISAATCTVMDAATLLEFKNDFYCQYINPAIICPFDTWIDGTNCCTWTGVTCNPLSGLVTNISITAEFRPPFTFQIHRNENTQTNFGESLPKLKALQDISLYYLKLHTTLPTSWSQITNLKRLYVYGVDFYGEIPKEYDQLVNLRIFHLDALSPTYFSTGLNGTGGIPPLCNLRKLREFVLNLNPNLSGGLPRCIDKWSKLERLVISNGGDRDFGPALGPGLFGNVPAALGTLKRLTVLELIGNSFTGTIPESIGNLRHLQYLGLAQNQLTGDIPTHFGNLLKSLTTLDMRENRLSGEIPQSIGSIQQLTYLDLGNNSLSGRIPETVNNLHLLSKAYLPYNNLTGPVPQKLKDIGADLTGNHVNP